MSLRSKKPRLKSAHKDAANNQMMIVLDPASSQGRHTKDKQHSRDGVFGANDASQHGNDGPKHDEWYLVEGENIVVLPSDHVQIIFKVGGIGIGQITAI